MKTYEISVNQNSLALIEKCLEFAYTHDAGLTNREIEVLDEVINLFSDARQIPLFDGEVMMTKGAKQNGNS